MANEYIERVTPRGEKEASVTEVANLLFNDSREVAESSKEKSKQLIDEYGSRSEVKRKVKTLLQRFELMAQGILPDAPGASLSHFLDFLNEQTYAMNGTLEIVVDNHMLAGAVERYGMSVQGNMVVNRLLSDEAKKRLAEVSDEFSNDEED